MCKYRIYDTFIILFSNIVSQQVSVKRIIQFCKAYHRVK